MASALSFPAAHAATNMTNEPFDMAAFKAPSWAGDWCPRCEWAQTCTDCRAGWI